MATISSAATASPETAPWTLVGVAVGAILGGLAQILSGWLAERRRHQQWLRERRAENYQHFLNEATRRYRALWDAVVDDFSPDPPEDYLVAVHDLVSDMELFGTAKAVSAARATTERLIRFMGAPRAESDTLGRAVEDALEEYRKQIRADLGVT